MAAMLFFLVFSLNVIYLFLARSFISQVNLDRGDPGEGIFSFKNAVLLNKYIFFINSDDGLGDDAKSLLWVVRIILVLSLSMFVALLVTMGSS